MATNRREQGRLNGHAVAPARRALDLPSPYPGLATYGATDAARFFGRTSERRLVVANLRAARVTIVHGPSGVGKSSLLYAGVVPALRAIDPPPPLVTVSRWDADTMSTLSADILAAVVPGRPRDTPPSFDDAMTAVRDRQGDALILILDQFEEYLRLADTPALAGFEDALAELAGSYHLLARVLIAVREDQLAGLDRFDGLIPDVFGNVIRLEPLTREAAGEAIEGPLEQWNAVAREHGADAVSLEPGLEEQLLDDLCALSRDREERDHSAARIAPPLLALTMRRLWDADVGGGANTLRRATLDALGGAGRILATHLDDTMGALPVAEQELAANMLRYLVTPSGVTRAWSPGDLAAYIDAAPTAIEALAEKLARPPARVLRAVSAPGAAAPRTEYELAHDVLARPAREWEARYRTGRLERRLRRLMLAVLTVSITALGLIVHALSPGPVTRLEQRTVDARFAIRGAEPADRDVVIVTVGNAEFARLHGPTDTSRAAYAQAIGRIAAAGARVIALDIFFDARKSPSGDAALIAAVHRYGSRIVLGADMLDNSGGVTLFGRPQQTFTDASAPAVGYGGFPGDPLDPHTVIRTMERGVALPGASDSLHTFAVVVARVAGMTPQQIAQLPRTTWIDFRGGAGTYPTVPLAAVLAGSSSALATLRGAIVLVGITATVEHDVHNTAAPGQSRMGGTEVQANAVSTALRSFPLRSLGTLFELILIAVLGVLPLVLGLRLPAQRCLAAVGGLAVIYLLAAQLAFDAGWVLEVVIPLATLLVSGLAVTGALLRGSRRPGATPRPAAEAPASTAVREPVPAA